MSQWFPRVRPVPALLGLIVTLALAPASWAAGVKVVVEGIEGDEKANVLRFLSINRLDDAELNRRDVERAHRLARSEIAQALQPFGYYEPTIEPRLTREDASWRAFYRIDVGAPTTIASLKLRAEGEGAADEGIQSAIARSRLAEGGRLDHTHYSETRAALLQAAYAAGYIDAAYTASVIRVQPAQNSADIELLLETGPRFYFGPTTIHQDALDDAFVRRYLTFEQGDPFNTDRLTELQLALSDTDYFSQVEIQADREDAIEGDTRERGSAPQVPVVVTAKARKPQRYTISGGYGTDTGVRGGLGVELRRLNGRGHKLRSDLRISEVKQALTARYVVPINNVTRDSMTYGATVKDEEYGDFDTRNYGVGVARKDGWGSLRREFYLNAEREDFSIQDGGTRDADIVDRKSVV